MIPRIVFMGSSSFAVPALQALVKAGIKPCAVYCQPPRPAGRGHVVQPVAVHQAAESMGIMVKTQMSLRGDVATAELAALKPDALIVVSYGLILPSAVLAVPRCGSLNIHASLLPRWRGAAPIQRAIEAGDAQTGVSLMVMDKGLDTGDVLAMRAINIESNDDALSLESKLAEMGAQMLIENLQAWLDGKISAVPQSNVGMTYAAKITRADGRLDWHMSAAELVRRVKAFVGWPKAWFHLAPNNAGDKTGEDVKVLEAEAVELPDELSDGTLGDIVGKDMTIRCGKGGLRILLAQRPGRRPVSGAELRRWFAGSRVY